MKTNMKLIGSILLLALTACGDNKEAPDAREGSNGSGSGSDSFPAAPTLGAQIDRIGRPAINTLLNHGFDPTAAAGSAKDAYNAASDPTMWVTQFRPTFMQSLGVLDALDTGICGNTRCESIGAYIETNATCPADCPTTAQVGSGNACGNQVFYNGQVAGGGSAQATSYAALATILSDDQLYLDTGRGACPLYFAVEFAYATTGMRGSYCGGRALEYDVVDMSLSVTTMGISGVDIANGYVPRVKDNAGPHTNEYSTTFPYLGAPH